MGYVVGVLLSIIETRYAKGYVAPLQFGQKASYGQMHMFLMVHAIVPRRNASVLWFLFGEGERELI